jgi:Integrase zinc binding domain
VINAIQGGGELTLNTKLITDETYKDPILNVVANGVMNGWRTDALSKTAKNYFAKNSDLSLEMNCLLYGSRVIIPKSLHNAVLKVLHTNHLGIVRMKQIARQYVFWEGVNEDIERFVKQCEACQLLMKNNQKKEYGKWPETSFPFERVHIDFFYLNGKDFLLIDAYSRWLEIKMINKKDAEMVIDCMEDICATFGYPVECVCDNGMVPSRKQRSGRTSSANGKN